MHSGLLLAAAEQEAVWWCRAGPGPCAGTGRLFLWTFGAVSALAAAVCSSLLLTRLP